MAGRIRSIKPEMLDDEVLAGLSDAAWRLWVGIKLVADDYGNVRFGDRYLAANIWQDTTRDVSGARQELIEKGLVSPYAVAGQRYAHIVGWEREQRIDNAGKPRVPQPKEDDGTWDQALTGNLAANRREPPRVSATLGDSPLDLRSPISDPDPDPDHRPTTGDRTREDAPRSEVAEPVEIPAHEAAKGRSRGKPAPIDEDWRPAPATIAWCHAEGVDGDALVEAFREYWRARFEDNPRDAKAKKSNWDRAFKQNVRWKKEHGQAPPWRPPTEWAPPPIPRDVVPPEQARKHLAALEAALAKAGRLPFDEAV